MFKNEHNRIKRLEYEVFRYSSQSVIDAVAEKAERDYDRLMDKHITLQLQFEKLKDIVREVTDHVYAHKGEE